MDFQIVIKLLGSLLMLCGVILIFDARTITKKLFSFGDQNEASKGLKIVGFIIAVIGGILL